MQRPFTSGSRQAPDPFDQYLEPKGFYRKHTARDSSCLFRTISEQLYDTQHHHLSIRQACVDYMRAHKNTYQQNMARNIDEYLDEMSKPKTFGTFVELRAMAYLYGRNVLLFEAFNTGTWMVQESYHEDVFRVFFTPEKHFDSVFTNEFIEIAAFCQAICYEILYKRVFKLPDVSFAVEQMLHATSFEYAAIESENDGNYAKRILLDDGRAFEFDRPEDTCCILENYKLCHFHNSNFTQFTESLNQEMCLMENYKCETHRVTRTVDALLPEKYISCVRQLLNTGITPFPYKVAKALDPDMYRNIEFDAWSEIRKEQRFKDWYTGGSNLQVGVKCLVKLRNSQSDFYTCHIQEMSPDRGPCLVYIEDLGEKHIVPYDYLQPLPSELAKPWPLPFRFQRHVEKYPTKNLLNHLKKNHRNVNMKTKSLEITHSCDIMKSSTDIFAEEDSFDKKGDIVCKLKQYTTFQNFRPAPIEFISMPLNFELKNNDNSKKNRRNSNNSRMSHSSCTDITKQEMNREDGSELEYLQPTENYYSYSCPSEHYYPYSYDSSIIHAGSHGVVPNGPPYYCMYNSSFPPSNRAVPHNVYVPPPVHCAQGPNGFYPTPYFPPPASATGISDSTVSNNRNASASSSIARINYSAIKSEDESGADLPNDVPTVRFFYNLGCEYYKKYGNANPADTQLYEKEEKKDDLNKVISTLQNNFSIASGNESSVKSDNNNNVSNNSNQGQNPRRFHSRYFNRRDKCGYRGGSRHSSTDFNKLSNKNNTSFANAGNRNSASNIASTDQGIQTSPSSVITTSEANEYTQSPPVNSTHTSYISVYPNEGDQQPALFVPQPIMPVTFGMFPPSSLHPTNPGPTYQTYVGSAPAAQSFPIPASSYPAHPTYYPAIESSSAAGLESPENGHYTTYMSYSPVYYSANNGSGQPTASVHQGYWYTAPPPSLPPVSAAPITQANAPSTSPSNVSQ